ncbi:MAG: adenylate/guanylate cyclase domain-containing protein [Chloroflexota bacterium]
MLSELVNLPSQAIFPIGIAITYIILCFYLLSWRRPDNSIDRLFIAFLSLTVIWNIFLTAELNFLPPVLIFPWHTFLSIGLIVVSFVYWMFARAFLQLPWKPVWRWLVGIVGVAVTLTLDQQWVFIPETALVWSNGWLHAQNLGFVASVFFGGFFLLVASRTAFLYLFLTENPSHRNRIWYLLISTLTLMTGYGLYLNLQEPFWTIGLLIIGIGGGLTTYTVAVEDLIDLSTGIRRVIRGVVVTAVAVSAYVVGIYLVQIFLGDFLSALVADMLDQTLVSASIAAVLLIFVYNPIRRLTAKIANRLLFGQGYDLDRVIQSYSQTVNNRLYLSDLADVAMNHINEALGLSRSTLFIVEAESSEQVWLRTLPTNGNNGSEPTTIALSKDTPVTNRLIDEKQPLAQYTIDISNPFKAVPENERHALRRLNVEWYIPIQKEGQLIGMFALGPKQSKQPYRSRDLRLLTTLADQTALALENASLFDRIQRHLEDITRINNLLDGVFESMDNGVLTTDTEGNITLYNHAVASIMGQNLDEYIGSSFKQALPALADTIFAKLVQNVVDQEAHYHDYELISEIPDRGKIDLNLSLTPLKDAQHQTQGVTIVMDDVTETKRLRAVHDMFRRYVSPAVVDRLPEDPSDLELGGHRQEVTILFADIRGFTSFSENLEPEALMDILNQYLSMAASAILLYEGTLDKFMGDAVMGIFNAPLHQDDHILRAVQAAATMQRNIRDYHLNTGHNHPLSFGVGIHVGECVVGNVGLSDRMDYTAIGDAVNLAKRIQENAPGNKVLLSHAIYESVQDSVKASFYKQLQVKGREQPVGVYELKVF